MDLSLWIDFVTYIFICIILVPLRLSIYFYRKYDNVSLFLCLAFKGQKDQNVIVYSIYIYNVLNCIHFFVLMVGKIRFVELSNSADSF